MPCGASSQGQAKALWVTQTTALVFGKGQQRSKSFAQVVHGQVLHPVAGSYAKHFPVTQTSLVAQTVVQSPQCCGSFFVSTHAPLHSVLGLLQLGPQTLFWQFSLAPPHATPPQ